jgi:hypothetical protein
MKNAQKPREAVIRPVDPEKRPHLDTLAVHYWNADTLLKTTREQINSRLR